MNANSCRPSRRQGKVNQQNRKKAVFSDKKNWRCVSVRFLILLVEIINTSHTNKHILERDWSFVTDNFTLNFEDLFQEAILSLFLAASRSHSTTSMAAARLPHRVLEVVFSYLDISDLRNCSLVCKNWYKYLNDEDNDVWRIHCVRKLAEEALKSDILSNVPTYKAKLRAFYHAWNPNDCSKNIYIKSNGFTVHRNPVAQSTDGARGKIGFRTGRHCWEVWWEGPLGTVAMIGLATQHSSIQSQGYTPLIGGDTQSWGWNLVDNHLIHNGDSQGNYPLLNNAPKYQVMFDLLPNQTDVGDGLVQCGYLSTSNCWNFCWTYKLSLV